MSRYVLPLAIRITLADRLREQYKASGLSFKQFAELLAKEEPETFGNLSDHHVTHTAGALGIESNRAVRTARDTAECDGFNARLIELEEQIVKLSSTVARMAAELGIKL